MEAYELDQDKIISWATSYAGYSELETTAKALYSVFKSRQKSEKPEAYKEAKAIRKKYNKRRVKK